MNTLKGKLAAIETRKMVALGFINKLQDVPTEIKDSVTAVCEYVVTGEESRLNDFKETILNLRQNNQAKEGE